MSCASCRHSRAYFGALWCRKWQRIVAARCEAFEYEPGTDEGER
jgi:hypothetical protein